MRQKSNEGTGQVTAAQSGHAAVPAALCALQISGLNSVAVSEKLSARNKTLIFRFLIHISPEVSERRLTFYTHKLHRLGCWLGRDFDKAGEEDIRALLTFISKSNAMDDGGRYSQGTLHGYKVSLKRFYRWLEGQEEDYPRKVRWIKTSGDTTRIHEPEQLLTSNEVWAMIRHARSPRDKAMISFLYESGARVSEMLSMKVRHLEFTPTVLKATLPASKTTLRTLPLVSCKGHMATWMNYHPLKDNPEAPLWSNLKGDGSNPLTGQTVASNLKATAAAAGVNKRIYPHLFRACSITHKQRAGWPEQAIKMFHGLCKDSKVMKHYSHLSYGNLEDIQRQMNGLPVKEANELNRGVKCPKCGKVNPLYTETCECGLPTELNAKASDTFSESDIEARLEQKMQKFVETRSAYDSMADQFMKALLEKAEKSPPLLRVLKDISENMKTSEPRSRQSCPPNNQSNRPDFPFSSPPPDNSQQAQTPSLTPKASQDC